MFKSKRNSWILLLLFAGVLMGALDLSVVGPAIPAIEKTIPLSGRDISWIFSIYLLFYLFGIPLSSKLSDVYGRRLVYILSVAVCGIGSAIVSLSHELTPLLLGRAIQGFGASGIFPVAAATIGDLFPVAKRGRALGVLGAVFGIAFILGPILAGTILRFFTWNTIFLVNLPIAVILVIFAAKILPGIPEGKKPAINWVGTILLILVLTSLTLGLNNMEAEYFVASIFSWNVMPFLLLVLVLSPVIIRNEQKERNPTLGIRVFNSPQLRLTGLIAFGLGIYQSSIVFIPKLAVELFQVSPAEASFMLLPLVVTTAMMPPVYGWFLDKTGSRPVVITGVTLAIIALFIFSLLPSATVLFYAAEVGLGIGLAIRASLKYIVLNEVEAQNRATSLGMLIIFISIGQLTGAALMGAIITGRPGNSTGFGQAFQMLAGISILLFVLSLFLKKRNKLPRFI